ncbi:MAG TPA: glycoside hydrolase family 3 C-terminal domain-containing protein [Acidisarcina sp.]
MPSLNLRPAAAIVFIGLSVLTVTAACRAQDKGPVPDSPAIEQRVDAMIAKLTLEQKIDLIGGQDSMFIRAIPEINFPRLKMSDGPYGVRTWGPDTAYGAGIGLAASWDPELVRRTGESIAQDAHARGVHFLLAPGVNIYRAPMNGRNFEYFGEDPYLSAHTTVPYIEGVQSQGVIATVKHYALNNQEWDRHNASSDADERTIRELYLPAFEAAVKVAHVGAVMNSYNLINGVHATQSPFLNLQVLKKEWGFDGILMSDWDATYDGVAAANNGLDLEMPDAKFMNRKTLLPAVQSGQVTQATIDEKVRRIFRTAIRFGFLDHDQLDPSVPLYNQQGRQVALDDSRESIVLLKNEGNLLPLDPATIHTVAVLGPNAWPAVPGAGGSSTVTPYDAVSLLTGMSNQLGGKVNVLYARGLPTEEEIFRGTQFSDGDGKSTTNPWQPTVKVETFDNASFTGPAETRSMPRIAQWTPAEWAPPARKPQSIRYTASYTPAASGDYLILAATGGNDVFKLMVDGKLVLEQTRHEGQAPKFVEVPMTGGKAVAIQIDYLPGSATPDIGLGIRAASDLISAEAKKIASIADAVVIAAGFGPSTESEGFDRTFQLPYGQDELIHEISGLNKHTIVTLTGGGDVDTHRWLEGVPALLHNWYPGQEGGTAISEILFGMRSPEGKLPISFERSWEENPTHDNYYAPATPEGQVPHVKYAEGLYVGYRYYTSMNKKPLFPFGFGLSYTTFSFDNLAVAPGAGPYEFTVSFDVRNTGSRAGAEVAQLYLGDPSAKAKRPVRELKGFQKVRLDPGQSQHITLNLDKRSFSYWDESAHDWRADPGKFTVFVGDSSENTPLTSSLVLGK